MTLRLDVVHVSAVARSHELFHAGRSRAVVS
jgi:hypothetical protein